MHAHDFKSSNLRVIVEHRLFLQNNASYDGCERMNNPYRPVMRRPVRKLKWILVACTSVNAYDQCVSLSPTACPCSVCLCLHNMRKGLCMSADIYRCS